MSRDWPYPVANFCCVPVQSGPRDGMDLSADLSGGIWPVRPLELPTVHLLLLSMMKPHLRQGQEQLGVVWSDEKGLI